MTISKFLLFLCAAAGALCLTVRAGDTDNAAQAAARIAIAKELFAEQATNAPASSTGTNAVMAPMNDQKAQKEAKAKADKDAADAQAQAQVVAAQKIEADQAALATAQTNKLVNMDMSGTITNIAESATNSWASATPSESKPAATPKKDKKKKEKPAPPASTNAAPQKVSMADTNYIGGSLGMKPIPAPPLPISTSKDDRLKALLQKYQADQITPEEYHQQRAAILAEP